MDTGGRGVVSGELGGVVGAGGKFDGFGFKTRGGFLRRRFGGKGEDSFGVVGDVEVVFWVGEEFTLVS